MIEIILPWFPRELIPNARVHWSKKAKAAKAYRKACWALALQAGAKVDWDGIVHAFITFYPPDKRRRDDDNIIASFKAGRDGMAEALGIDDCRIRTHPYVSDDYVMGGAVRVRLCDGP